MGVSGGIDSALTAALAAEACRKLGISLYGRSITIETNTEAEKERARAVGNAFCTDFREVDLTTLYLSVREEMEEVKIKEISREDKVRRGNIKARLRMIYLYNLAQQHKGMVLSTDNRTEYMYGFWTLMEMWEIILLYLDCVKRKCMLWPVHGWSRKQSCQSEKPYRPV